MGEAEAAAQSGAGGWIGPVADAIGSIFDFLGGSPRRIARQRDAARPDSLYPGIFNTKDNSAVTFIVITLVATILIIGMIVYATTRK